MREIRLQTERKTQLVDITERVREAVGDGATGAAALVYVPHTTAGVTINEHLDPALLTDVEEALARIVDDGSGPLLAAGADPAKDQSYMLAALPPELLSLVRFPLTELSKPEVREIASRHGLAVARKPESQDLCFLAGQGKERFLRRHAGLGERRLATSEDALRGAVLAPHAGLISEDG